VKKKIRVKAKREKGKVRSEKNAKDNTKNGNAARESEM